MNSPHDELELLITRELDGQATPADRRLLNAWLAADREANQEYEDLCRVDELSRAAMQTALKRAPASTRSAQSAAARRRWTQVGRGVALAAAACLAAIAWLQPRWSSPAPQNRGGQPAAPKTASWFAPARPGADEVEPLPAAYERPELQVRGTHREYLIIPGSEPGKFHVIQVDHVRTQVIVVQRDF